jgi:hypothetical protein
MLLAMLALGACSDEAGETEAGEGGQERAGAVAAPAAHTDSSSTAGGTTTAMAAHADSLRAVIADSAADSAPGRPEVVRETFAYAGGPRDPFSSLLKGERLGPEFLDLQLVGVYQDLQYPSNSVAIVRDRVEDKRYKVRAGDQLGTLRVREIRAKDVVFTVQDFGYSRQEILSLRKQEDVTP